MYVSARFGRLWMGVLLAAVAPGVIGLLCGRTHRASANPPTTLPTREHTFAHQLLDMEAEVTPVPESSRKVLDSIFASARKRIVFDATPKDPPARRRQAIQILKTIDSILTEHNILFPPGDEDVLSLSAGLAERTLDDAAFEEACILLENKRRAKYLEAHRKEKLHCMDCDISSIVYVGIGEALGIDIRMVDLPGHVFVRWHFSDSDYLDWDTNNAQVDNDSDYKKSEDLTDRQIKDRIYLASLSRDEALGYCYDLRADSFAKAKKFDKAIADYRRSIALYPQAPVPRRDLAWLYLSTPGLAIPSNAELMDLARYATRVEAQNAKHWDTLACAYAAGGNFSEAIRCADRAQRLADEKEGPEFAKHRKAFEGKKTWLEAIGE